MKSSKPKFKFRPNKSIDGPRTVTNGQRAEWAKASASVFRTLCRYPERDDWSDPLADLICDLGHFADSVGEDFDIALQRGLATWKDER